MDVYEDMLYLIPKRTGYYLNKIQEIIRKKVSDIALAGITNKIFTYTYSGTEYSS